LLEAIHEQFGIRPEHEAQDISLNVTARGVERLGHAVNLPLHGEDVKKTLRRVVPGS
jgi:hypothetical protein